jgi:2-iminobutanoate/2-iminopropanoate deaminase
MRIIESKNAPKAIGPYSQAVGAHSMVFCSGQLGVDPNTGQLAGPDVATQTRRALKNLKAVLKKSGLTLSHVAKTTVYLADMKDFAEVNAIYAEAFDDHKPARATVQVAALPLGGLIEIDAIALGC